MTDNPPPRLEMTDVHKSFGATRALDGVDLQVQPGQVHALIGENGAGKSTLMRILAGVYAPDSGRMTLDDRPYAPASPLDARRRGVAMIHQELSLAPHLTVEANVLLGQEPRRWGCLRPGRARSAVRSAFDQLHRPDIPLDVPVRRLGAGMRQLVEIARALAGRATVLVMDEPTSALSAPDARNLFEVIGRLRRQGVSIIYISHFLEEIETIADRFTVLRDGRISGRGRVGQFKMTDIAEMMVGRRIAEMFPRLPHHLGEPVLRLQGLSGPVLPRQLDLALRRGEILGVFGLIGAGRTELARAVFGLDQVRSGTVTVAGICDRGASPTVRLRQGLGMLCEDRKTEGLALSMSVADNLTLSRLSPLGRWGWVSRRRQAAATDRWMRHLDIRARDPDQSVADLSGGNQQKVALARLLHHDVDVLLLDEPTRGIDVGSKVQIYRLIGELAGQGKAVIFISSYLPELIGVCDRIAVMCRGRLVAARPAGEWTETEIMAAATGVGR